MKPFNLQKFLAGEPITTLGGHQVVAFRYDTNFNDIFPLTVAIKDNTGLISNYQYSIDGEPLGTIDSNYILCMKDTELSINNNKQQTAVDLFAIALYENGFLTGNGDEIQELLEKAKAIDKGQRQHLFEQSRLNNKFVGLKYKSFDEYYNETYGRDEQW